MLAWVSVLGHRLDMLRAAAESARREQQQMRSLAHSDALTGLANRRGLHEALSEALQRASPERPLAVYLIDLDGFKPINDRYGHDAGDQLLREYAQRLRLAVRTRDVVARLGGDEFVVVAVDLRGDVDAQAVGRKLQGTVTDPFHIAGEACRVGQTVGFVVSPGHADPEVLLKAADSAMYEGKRAGRGSLRRGRLAAA
jgi:diguanylate cyclase (GGDEF)-like protein